MANLHPTESLNEQLAAKFPRKKKLTTKRHTAKRYAYVVGASDYGGPGDPSSGHIGSSGTDLTGKFAFAELGMGTALGKLPMGTKLRITSRGSAEETPFTVIAEKLDIGRGGDPVKGHARRIDLWYQTANALHFKGLGLVEIERLDGKPIAGPNDQVPASNTNPAIAMPEGANTTKEAGPFTEGETKAAESAVNTVGGFLGELSLKKVLLALVALGLGAFALLWLSHDITGGL